MDAAYIPLVTGFAGALIGAASSVLTILIQSITQSRRERLRIIADLAIKDHSTIVEPAKASPSGAEIPPVAAFVNYHRNVLDIIAKRSLNPEDVDNLIKDQRAITEVMYHLMRNR